MSGDGNSNDEREPTRPSALTQRKYHSDARRFNVPCASLGRSLPVPRNHGVNVTRSNRKPHDIVKKRGDNVQLCRPRVCSRVR